MNSLGPVALALAALVCLPSTAAAATDDSPLRHSVAVSGGGGPLVASKYVYDGHFQKLTAGQIGVDYTYRVAAHLNVGAAAAGLFLFGSSERAANLWTLSPTIGLHFGEGAIQGGARLGIGAVYGERLTQYSEASGLGLTADLMGELAWAGPRVDLVGRAGFRYVSLMWKETPPSSFYADEFNALSAIATLGVRAKF